MVSHRSISSKRLAAINLAVFASLGASTVLANTQTSTWVGPASSTWNTAAAWSPSGVPNNGTNGFTDYNVIIGTPAPAILNISPTIDDLTMNTGGTLGIQFGNTLTLNGATQTNNGQIVVDSNQGGATTVLAFDFAGTTSLTGSGTITLNEVTTDAQLNTGAGDTLNQASTHTIAGFGEVNAALINNGTVTANVNGQTLNLGTDNMTNSATFSASNGGTLSIGGITVTQGASGNISAATGSEVLLSNSAITGGTLSSAGTGVILLPNTSSTNTFTNVTSNAAVNVQYDSQLNITGNLVDNGTLTINSNQGGAVSEIDFSGGTLSGTGTFVLNDVGNDAQIDGTVIQAAGHSITGFGEINAALTNNGLVNANVNGQSITLTTNNMTNNATIEATAGGDLAISGITVTQGTAGLISVAPGGTLTGQLTLTNATISGGKLSTSSGGVILLPSSSVTSTFANVTSNAVVDVGYDSQLNITGNLVDNGTVTINYDQGGAVSEINFSGGTLSGTGTFVLNETTSNAQLNGTLTQAAGHTIQGFGEINAALTNDGLVNANVNAETLTLQSNNMANNGTMEATNGGSLTISGITVTQGASDSITAASGSEVNVVGGSTISGGSLTANNGTLEFAGGAVLNGTTITATNSTVIIPLDSNSSGTAGFAASFGGVTISAGTVLDEQYGNVVNVTSSTLTNNGSIVINSNQGGLVAALDFNFVGATALNGSGTITLNENSGNAQLNTGAGDTLTVAAAQTIQGFGNINAAMTNNGTINANVNGQLLNLQTSPITNNNLIEATAGGVVSINGITVTQGTAGLITANAGTGFTSFINLDNATISGGTISSSVTGTGVAYAIMANNVQQTSTFANVTSDATIYMGYNNQLNITGNLVDNGTVNVDYSGGGDPTVVNFNGGTLSGTGSFVLTEGADAEITGTLTQAATHSITGYGVINAALTNKGLVNANVNGQILTLTGANEINDATIEATNGGVVSISGITITQGTAGLISANAAAGTTTFINLNNATISSGTIATSGAGSAYAIMTNNAQQTSTFASVTSDATIYMGYNNQLNITGNLVDNGTINVDYSGGGDPTVVNFNGGNLSGTGTFVLTEGADAEITGTLTQAATHSITGYGVINAALTNNGLVNANVNGQTITLTGANETNNSTIEATGGGEVLLTGGVTITQGTAGLISANAATSFTSVVVLDGATISGGTLSTSGAGTAVVEFPVNSGTTSTLANVTSNSIINIPYGNELNITGNLVDNGAVNINNNGGGILAEVNFNGGTLSGTGTFSLTESPDAQITGSLTQAAGHTIQGYGVIKATLTNNGVVKANTAGQVLVIGATVSGTGSLVVSPSAELQIATGTGLVAQGSLNVDPTGIFDITNNHVVINYGVGNPSPISTLVPEIISGYNGGAWTGRGITSSAAAANKLYAVGYADGSLDSQTSAAPGTVLIKYTLIGDVNLDGTVNLTDLLLLLNSYGQTGKDWAQGDTNYDGSVNLTDLLALLNSYGEVSNGAQTTSFQSNQVVPEPVSGGVLLLAAGGTLMSRRRRVSKSSC